MELRISSIPATGRSFIVQYVSLILIILVFVMSIVGRARAVKFQTARQSTESPIVSEIALGEDIPLLTPHDRSSLSGVSQVLKTHDLRAEIFSSGGGIEEALPLAQAVKSILTEEGVPSEALSVRWDSQVAREDALVFLRLFHQDKPWHREGLQ